VAAVQTMPRTVGASRFTGQSRPERQAVQFPLPPDRRGFLSTGFSGVVDSAHATGYFIRSKVLDGPGKTTQMSVLQKWLEKASSSSLHAESDPAGAPVFPP